MAHSLNLRVVAEGVEQAEELAFLREHRCDEAQGYYFSRPVPAARLVDLLVRGIPNPLGTVPPPSTSPRLPHNRRGLHQTGNHGISEAWTARTSSRRGTILRIRADALRVATDRRLDGPCDNLPAVAPTRMSDPGGRAPATAHVFVPSVSRLAGAAAWTRPARPPQSGRG